MQRINNVRQERSARNSPIASSEEVAEVVRGWTGSASRDGEDESGPTEYRCRVCGEPVEWPGLVCEECSQRDREEQEWESYLDWLESNDAEPGRGDGCG